MTPTDSFFPDVPVPDSNATIDFYIPKDHSEATPIVVYFHGGAWRSGSKTDEKSSLLDGLVNRGIAVASVEYQLSPAVAHPQHHNDAVAAFEFIATGSPLPFTAYDASAIFLAGYSAGAFLAARLCLDTRDQLDGSTPGVAVPSTDAVSGVTGVICIDGIYDLGALLDEYPHYDFVQQAFGDDADDAYARFSPAAAPGHKTITDWLVLQSPDDELLSIRQSHEFMQHINTQGHHVHQDYISGTHYELIHRPELVDVIVNFVQSIV